MHEISGSNPVVMHIFFKNVLYWYIRVYASIYASEMSCTSIYYVHTATNKDTMFMPG